MKTYLGDGVYLSFDGYHLILTTENGLEILNTIYLDIEAFCKFMEAGKDLFQFEKEVPVNLSHEE